MQRLYMQRLYMANDNTQQILSATIRQIRVLRGPFPHRRCND